MDLSANWEKQHASGGNMMKNKSGLTSLDQPKGDLSGAIGSLKTTSLQPMFVTNRTSIEDIDHHLADAQTRIVVVTIERSNSHGALVVEHIGQKYPDVRIVLVCDGTVQEVLSMSFKTGVWACVGRHSSVETLRTAIDNVAAGQRFIAEDLTQESKQSTPVASHKVSESTFLADMPQHNTVMLTRREKQVLSLIAQGRPRREIAELLSVSPRTIDAYRARLLQKLSLDSSVQLVKYAISTGLAS